MNTEKVRTRPAKVREFESTGEAYDATQCDDTIRDGDVLWIPSEKVVGLAHTWPVAVTAAPGELHQLKEDGNPLDTFTAEQVEAAVNFAKAQGLTLDAPFAEEEAATPADPRAPITDPAAALAYMLAGNATVTLVSKKTGTRFTYKIRRKEGMNTGEHLWFVGYLRGPDNDGDYTYMGTIFPRPRFGFTTTRGTKVTPSAPCLKAFYWAFAQLEAGRMPETLEVWHEGKCGMCGRKLTVPSSIESGLGPVCASKMQEG